MSEELEIEDIDFVINDLQRAISQIAGTIQVLKKQKRSKIIEKSRKRWQKIIL